MFFKKKLVCIIQARMGSSRLPGKVLMNIMEKPVLLHLIQRLRSYAHVVDKIVVATTTSAKDDPICSCCDKWDVPFYRGSELDVMERVRGCAEQNKAHYILDITSDCPLVDPWQINEAFDFLKKRGLDYISNVVYRDWPDGFDFQIYTRNIYEEMAYHVPAFSAHHSHTGWNILQYQSSISSSLNRGLKIQHYPFALSCHHPEWGLTLDEKEDLALLTRVFIHFEKEPWTMTAKNIVEYLEKYPELLKINEKVKRKIPGQG